MRLQDKLKVPEVTYSTNDDFRLAFEAAHPDVELVQNRTSQEVGEKLQCEVTVHGRIFYCELAEVRLASEEILSKPSLTFPWRFQKTRRTDSTLCSSHMSFWD